jgi:AcrR family transcriptional regulator
MNTSPSPPIRRSQGERSAASTAAMIDAAIELILEQGARVSMMAIGQRSGFSHGLVLARFGSKAGLIEAVAHEARRRFAASFDSEADETTGIEKVRGLIDAFLSPPSTAGKAFSILLGESLGPDPLLRDVFVRADEALRQYVQAHLEEARSVGDIDPTTCTSSAAVLLVGMLRGVAMQYCVNPNAFDIEALRAQAHGFLASLGNSKARRKKLGGVTPGSVRRRSRAPRPE